MTWLMCDKKWRNLKGTYTKIKDSNKQTGRGRKTWEYYNLMDDAIGHKASSSSIAQLLHGTTQDTGHNTTQDTRLQQNTTQDTPLDHNTAPEQLIIEPSLTQFTNSQPQGSALHLQTQNDHSNLTTQNTDLQTQSINNLSVPVHDISFTQLTHDTDTLTQQGQVNPSLLVDAPALYATIPAVATAEPTPVQIRASTSRSRATSEHQPTPFRHRRRQTDDSWFKKHLEEQQAINQANMQNMQNVLQLQTESVAAINRCASTNEDLVKVILNRNEMISTLVNLLKK